MRVCEHAIFVSLLSSPCPCSRLYYRIYKEHYGDQRREALTDRVLKLAETHPTSTKVDVTDGDLVIAIVTPLMLRCHQLPEAAELVFVDAGGNVDRSQARVFLFMTHSVCGGLPLGVVITNGESEATLVKAFQLLRSMLPEGMYCSVESCILTYMHNFS